MKKPLWLLLFSLLSGMAGLAHQIIWTRRLVDLFGAGPETFAKVTGAFFLGLALGSCWASQSRASDSLFWRRVAGAEFMAGLLALPILFCLAWEDWLGGSSVFGSVLQLLLPMVLVTPPAMAMGLVLPWIIRGVAAQPGFDSKLPVWLYSANILGGVLGLGLAVGLLLPMLGLIGASLAVVVLNLALAGSAAGLGRRCPELARSSGQDAKLPRHDGSRNSESIAPAGFPIRLLAFASGFLVLAQEVILERQLAQVTINSLFSSSLVLALVLVALAMAAGLLPWVLRWCGGDAGALRMALSCAAILCAAQPFLLTGVRGGVTILPYELAAGAYMWEIVKLGLLAICPMLLAAGLVFPLVLRNAVGQGHGRNAGRVLAWNGAGGWLGAELGQTILAPNFGLWTSMAVIGAGYVALLVVAVSATRDQATFNAVRETSGRKLGLAWFGVAASALALAVSYGFGRLLPQTGLATHERLAALEVGREGVVATIGCGPGDWRMLFNNSYTLGGSKAQVNQERQAHLPLLLHGEARTVAMLGVATGSSVAGAALHPGVERIDAIELSSQVLAQAEAHFGPFNRRVFENARVRFLAADARRVIAACRQEYDVVIGDLFLPWRTGEGRLYSVEHFENVRSALKPGGVFCQWLPLFQLTREQFDAIARSFERAFPDTLLVRGDFYAELPVAGLVGGRRLDQLDWALIRESCARLRSGGEATDPLVRHAEGVAMLIGGRLPAPPPGPVNTLANAWLEWDASRNILGMESPWFVGVPWAAYIRDIQREAQESFPPELRAAHEAGQFALTLEIAAKFSLPSAENLKAQIGERLPSRLLQDLGAAWDRWPSIVKPARRS